MNFSELNLPSFLQLKRYAKQAVSVPDSGAGRLAVLGDGATQHLCTAIRGFAAGKNFPLEVFEADYNQILPQIMDRESELYRFSPDAVLIAMCVEKLYEKFTLTPIGQRGGFADQVLEQIVDQWKRLNQGTSARIFQFNFAEVDDRIFGNYANRTSDSFLFQLRKINFRLMEMAQLMRNVGIVDVASLQSFWGYSLLHDPKLYDLAKIPFPPDALPLVAREIVSMLEAVNGSFKKCVILDLDNVLWGGVIGDVGLNGIEIGDLGAGHAFTAFQRWLKELKERGILLGVCSKNDDAIAREPFEKHPAMVLRLEDIAIFVANWEDKASNICAIQKTLNIGMNSMVFLDDNPFERNLVRGMVPEIIVPELPEDPSLYVEYLQSLNLFETASYSAEDCGRTRQYRAEVGRQQQEKSFSTFDDYLKSLEMIAECKSFDAFNFPRIAQLTQRSNQFNLRTRRYTEAEIAAIAADSECITFYYTLEDKFGSHGLISVVILKKQSPDTLFVDTWLMSCRVLKRGMEEFIMNQLIDTARQAGFRYIEGEYLPTPKNAMVANIYEKLGFIRQGTGHFLADVEKIQDNPCYIIKK